MHGEKSAKLEAQSLFIPAARKMRKPHSENMNMFTTYVIVSDSHFQKCKVDHGILDRQIDDSYTIYCCKYRKREFNTKHKRE
jgi:hypothetical protein